LVTTGHEYTRSLFEQFYRVFVFAVFSSFQSKNIRSPSAQLFENRLIPIARIVEAGRGRDNDNSRFLAAAKVDKSVQYGGGADFLFTAADGDNPTARFAVTYFCWAH
jgi:hypothetical protein